jgi:hypothetical protein
MPKLTPIETYYHGYRFRSRLEARWAVFFDALGERWEYEPQGYKLDGEFYLPDFWLPERKAFLEVKPMTRWFALSDFSRNTSLEIVGDDVVMVPEREMVELYARAQRLMRKLAERSGYLGLIGVGVPNVVNPPVFFVWNAQRGLYSRFYECGWWSDDRRQAAMLNGQQARFEHGEHG